MFCSLKSGITSYGSCTLNSTSKTFRTWCYILAVMIYLYSSYKAGSFRGTLVMLNLLRSTPLWTPTEQTNKDLKRGFGSERREKEEIYININRWPARPVNWKLENNSHRGHEVSLSTIDVIMPLATLQNLFYLRSNKPNFVCSHFKKNCNAHKNNMQ